MGAKTDLPTAIMRVPLGIKILDPDALAKNGEKAAQ